MKKIYLVLILCVMSLEATVYENAEDGSTNRWVVTDNNPLNATINNIVDASLDSRVIELNGAGYENEYTIGGDDSDNLNAWNETFKRYLTFNLNSQDGFFLDVVLETANGLRYLRYRDDDNNLGIDEDRINIGLGYDAADGEWHKFTRNLSADLKLFDPNNKIIAVHGVQVRGNCKIDDIELSDKPLEKELIIVENAEDGKISRWRVIDNPAGSATISNVDDSDLNSKVIKFKGDDSYANRYELSFKNSTPNNLNLKWDMKTKEGFIIDIIVKTSLGERVLRYRDEPESNIGIDGDTIFYGLGYFAAKGLWHTYTRNLQKDIEKFEANNKVLSVSKFLIRANANLDNIELFSSPSKIYEDAEDGSHVRWSIYSGPDSAKITNKYDNELKSHVISLKGASYKNQYIIGGDLYDNNGWNDTSHTHIKWSMKNTDGYVVAVMLKTKNGNRYLEYDEAPFSEKNKDGESINYGLGYASTDGLWHTYIRDIVSDLKNVEPNNELVSIEGMVIIGSVEIDDLELFKIYHPTEHGAGFALTFDDNYVDNWFSAKDLFLEYGIKPTFFVSQPYALNDSHIEKLRILENNGAEIGGHTYDHKGITRDFHNDVNLIEKYINEQIVTVFDELKGFGFHPKSLAFPYGEHDVHYDEAVRKYFPYLRTTVWDKERKLKQFEEIYHKKGKNYNILAGDGIDNSYGNNLNSIKDAFIKASKNGEIITLYAHRILNDPNDHYAISPEKLEKVMQYSKELGLKSYTFREAYLISK